MGLPVPAGRGPGPREHSRPRPLAGVPDPRERCSRDGSVTMRSISSRFPMTTRQAPAGRVEEALRGFRDRCRQGVAKPPTDASRDAAVEPDFGMAYSDERDWSRQEARRETPGCRPVDGSRTRIREEVGRHTDRGHLSVRRWVLSCTPSGRLSPAMAAASGRRGQAPKGTGGMPRRQAQCRAWKAAKSAGEWPNARRSRDARHNPGN